MSVFNFKLKPTRGVEVISDLDALIEKPVAFKFQGRTHVIKPMTTETFFLVTQAITELEIGARGKNFTKEELIEGYIKVFSSVCDTIGKKEVESMSIAQAAALLQVVTDCITGKVHSPGHPINQNSEDEKKKTVSP